MRLVILRAVPHKTLSKPYPTTPAMAAGVADHVWTLTEIAGERLLGSPNPALPSNALLIGVGRSARSDPVDA
jgi:hypothetical protein